MSVRQCIKLFISLANGLNAEITQTRRSGNAIACTKGRNGITRISLLYWKNLSLACHLLMAGVGLPSQWKRKANLSAELTTEPHEEAVQNKTPVAIA
jgi:hypothetical protein